MAHRIRTVPNPQEMLIKISFSLQGEYEDLSSLLPIVTAHSFCVTLSLSDTQLSAYESL